MDIRSLKIFLKIFDTCSVSKTADFFSVNQSSISYTLDKLRAHFDDPLFGKLGRGITPTHRAIELEHKVRKIVSEFDGLHESDDFDPTDAQAPITIASNVTELLPELLAIRTKIWRTAPSLAIRFLEVGSRENIEHMLQSEKADVSITVKLLNYPSTLKAQSLLGDRPGVFYDASVRGPITTVEDYANARHATLDFGGNQKSNVEIELEKFGLTREIWLSAPNAHTLASMMAGTDLIATMQSRLTQSAFAGFACSPPPIVLPSVFFDLVWHRKSDGSGRNKWLRGQISAAFEGH